MLGVGDLAPDFELCAPNGERYSLDGRLTLAIFFKTSCPTCQYAWPFYERLYRAYKGASLEVWGISQHGVEKTRQYAAKYNATFPHLVDEDWRVSRRFNPEFVPTGFLIGNRKEIVRTFVSWNRAELEQISKMIASLLRIPSKEIIQREEDVVIFKPG